MPSGRYPRDTLTRPYRGHERVRQQPQSSGGSDAVVRVQCRACDIEIERSASAVRRAVRLGQQGHECKRCTVEATLRKRRQSRGF